MLPRFEVDERLRPVDLVSTVSARPLPPTGGPLPRPAPSVAVEGRPAVGDGPGAAGGRVRLTLVVPDLELTGWYDAGTGRLGLTVTGPDGSTEHRSRRHGRVDRVPDRLGLTLTGSQLTLLATEGEREGEREDWTVRARYDLRESGLDTGLVDWGALEVAADAMTDLRAGGFGQLGLRDVRLVTGADGEPLRDADGSVWLTATSAGPGFFPTAHTSVWRLGLREPGAPGDRAGTSRLEHTGDLWFRRTGADGTTGVYGDHATHLLRDGDRWLVATSTWADFDQDRNPSVRVVLARTGDDPRHGEHVLEAEELPLPTDGFRSVGVWDPHLVRSDDEWLVGYVSARRYFTFHPVLARGPALDELRLAAADTHRTATEGTTLLRRPSGRSGRPPAPDDEWLVLASDGRDGRRGQREAFPVLDLALEQVGTLDAPYPTNIPWPTLLRTAEGWTVVTFDGTPTGGPLAGYGTHGDLLVLREQPRR